MPDPLIDQYLRLAFHLDRHVPGFIDAFFGDPALKARALAEPLIAAEALVDRAGDIASGVEAADFSEIRREYLRRQIAAMETISRKLAGEPVPYEEEVAGCFDIAPERIPQEVFDQAIAELDHLLPGAGDLQARLAAYREGYRLDEPRTRQAIDVILAETRRRTAEHVELPEGESIEIAFVRDQPWSGYNWYLGSRRSRVAVNLDVPQYAHQLVNLAAHEGYPGHHTEHMLKSERLHGELGYDEMALQLTITPECVIHEGIATLAEEMIFPGEEGTRWKADGLYPALGIQGIPEIERRVQDLWFTLRAAGGNAALMRHVDGAGEREVVDYLVRTSLRSETESRHRLQFIDDPLWRPYVFTYHVGYELLGAWLDMLYPNDRWAGFVRLLTEQITPTRLRNDLSEVNAR